MLDAAPFLALEPVVVDVRAAQVRRSVLATWKEQEKGRIEEGLRREAPVRHCFEHP